MRSDHSQLLQIIILKFNPPVLLNLLGNIFPYCPAVKAIRRINSSSIDLPRRSMLDFHLLGPLGQVGLVVDMSVCLSVCLSPSHAIFFEASYWPSGHMISSRPLIGHSPSLPNLALAAVLLSASVERVGVSRMRDFY